MSSGNWKIGDITGGRKGQVECIAKFKEKANSWIKDGRKDHFTFSIMMACRYGKSDVQRCIAVEALGLRMASCALVIHPFPDLSTQFMDDGRIRAWRKRWEPELLSKNAKLLTDFGEEAMTNGEWLGSIHIQALVPPGRRKYIAQWVDYIKNATGLPPIIFVDETQSYTNNEWGTIPRLFQSMGCPVVVCTATPFRNDGDDVFGFYGDKTSTETVDDHSFKQNPDDKDTLIKTTTSKEVTEFKIFADAEVGFKKAWSEGVIAKVTTLPVDFTCEGWGTKEGELQKLSELSETDARRIIPELVRDNGFISEVVAKVIEQLDEFRKAGVEKPAAIFYGMNDLSGSSANDHQERIKAEIEKQSSSKLDCIVATMASDANETDRKSRDKISKFCCPISKKGDVLILKQMGSAGLDVDRCCVVVLLGSVRSQGQIIQQAMRGGNVTATKKHFVVIYPNEKIMQRNLDEWIKENGGTYKKEEIISVDTEIVPKGEERNDGGFFPSDSTESGAGDHEGSVISFEDVILVKFFLTVFPESISNYTYPQLAVKAKRLGIVVPDDFVKANEALIETTAVCDSYRKELGDLVKEITKRLFREEYGRDCNYADPADRGEFGKLKAKSASLIKRKANVEKSWDANDPRRSESISDYKKWVAAARDMLRGAE